MSKKPAFKVIIAGSRTVTKYDIVERAINDSGWSKDITEVISGGAFGVDKCGEWWAERHLNKDKIKKFPAAWNDLTVKPCKIKTNAKGEEYNALAGFNRNEEMALYADALIAVVEGDSHGTLDMIERAKAHNLKIYIYEV